MKHRLTALLACSILLTACGLSFCAPTKKEDPKPIPTGPECYTQAKFDAAIEKVHHRTIVESYRKVGVHDAKWDDKAVALLEAYARTVGKPMNSAIAAQLLKDGEALVALGCTDPMVLYAYASACGMKNDLEKAEMYFRKSMDGFEKSKYPKIRVRLAPVSLHKILKARSTANAEEKERLANLARKWNLEMLTDDSFLPGEQRLALNLLYSPLDEFPYPTSMDLYNAVKDRPGVDPYIVNVLGGRCHLRQGWKERGSGFAVDVTGEGWKAFEENLRAAYRLLVAAYKLHPEYPEAQKELIEIAMAGHAAPWESERLWFDRAVAAQMDYAPAYNRYFNARLPRWGGTHKEIYDFGVECLKTARFDTDVPFQFFYAVNTISGDIEGDPSYARKPETAEYTKQLWDGYEKSGKMGTADHCKTMKALSLWGCGFYEDAKSILDELGDRVDKSAAQQYYRVDFDKVREDLELLGDGPGKELGGLQALYDDGKLTESLKIAEQVLSKSADNKNVTRRAQHWVALLKRQIDLDKGGWVSITPTDADFAGWTAGTGEWTLVEGGSVQGISTGPNLGSLFTCRTSVGSHFELKGEFELVSPKDSDALAFIQFNGTWRNVQVDFPSNLSQIDIHWNHANWGAAGGDPEYKERNTFVIRYWDGKLSVDVNGKSMLGPYICNPDKGNDKNFDSDPELVIKVGGKCSKSACTVRFGNLQVRKLDKMPDDIAKKLESK